MQIKRAYKTKLSLNDEQQSYFITCSGTARFVFNWALADRKTAWETEKKSINKFEQKRRFNAWKKENAALA